VSCFGGGLKIRVARRNNQALAAILTLRHKNTLTYKYGASDAAYNSLGGVQLLHWTAIRDAKDCGLQAYDLGRSDADQSGLITFKDRWGAKQSTLTYLKFALTQDLSRKFADSSAKSERARGFLGLLPKPVVSLLGRTLYKHVG
jgi:CelD/BcsL family acetyltransferase involved in cellulose biosynthesis